MGAPNAQTATLTSNLQHLSIATCPNCLGERSSNMRPGLENKSGGCTKLLCLGPPPNRRPIAIQSRSHRFQSRSNVGHRCCFCFAFRCLISSAAFLHPCLETGRKCRSSDGQGLTGETRPIAVQSRSNRGPIAEFGGQTSVCSFQTLPVSRFRKHSLGLRRRNQHSAFQEELLCEPVQ